MYLSLLTIPLTTFMAIGLFGRFIGARGTIVLSTFSAIVSTLISFLIFYEVALCRTPCQITLAPYFHSELFDANWGFLFDTLTAVMCVVVTLISCLVIIYSCSGDRKLPIETISALKLKPVRDVDRKRVPLTWANALCTGTTACGKRTGQGATRGSRSSVNVACS